MSLLSQISDLLGRALRSPAARRAARDLGRSAVEALHQGRSQDDAPRTGGRDGQRPAGRSGSPSRPADPRGTDRPSTQGRVAEGRGAGSRGGTSDACALRDRPSLPAPHITYAPSADGDADPGEIVWGWVPYEEDITRGKDRPVLVLALEDAAVGGSDGHGLTVIALMLTSKNRGAGTHVDEHGSTWVDIGTGAWDGKGRASEVRADRLLRLPAGSVRREGGRLDASRFERVAAETARLHGWGR